MRIVPQKRVNDLFLKIERKTKRKAKMKNVFKKAMVFVVIAGVVFVLLLVSILVFGILFFPIVMAIVKWSGYWLLWYCITIPVLSAYSRTYRRKLLKRNSI